MVPQSALGILGGESPLPPTHSLAAGPAAAEEYAREGLRRLALDWTGEIRLTYRDSGVMNHVYRLEVAGRICYLKQALARVKQHERLGAELAGVSPARIQADYRALVLLDAMLPEDYRGSVPRPLWYDAESNVLWTEEVAPGAVSLQSELEAGRCGEAHARRLGRLTGAIQAAGAGSVPPLWPTVEEDRANWERFLRLRTTGVLARAALPPEAEAAAHSLFREARAHERPGMLSHLDLAPKNVLIGDAGVGVLDFELGAAVSDPAYDPGFLIGHYLLMGANLPSMHDAASRAAGAFAAGYLEAASPVDAGWPARVHRYAGLTMLYRLYGGSPAPHLSVDRFRAIRRQGISLVLDAGGILS
jgi:aminoglycoside phosphotransferase (APT) family kinase protein